MLNVNYKSKQRGFILVTVMLLTMMAGTVVLTSLQDSTVQERLSGNYQKKINSRLIAEKGVYEALNVMDSELAANTSLTIDELVAQLVASEVMSGNDASLDALKYGLVIQTNDDDSSLGENEISVYSLGHMYEGQVKIKAIYELVTTQSSGSFPYPTGITGCEGISIGNRGNIDSYNSNLGRYNELLDNGDTNLNENATVQTVYGGTGQGNVTFQGATNILGDLNATGNVTFSNNLSSVTGAIHSNGTVTINQTTVDGIITALESISVKGGEVKGGLLALKDIYIEQTTIQNGIQAHENYEQNGGYVSGGILVGKKVSLTNWGSTIAEVAGSRPKLLYTERGAFSTDSNLGYDRFPYLITVADLPSLEEVPVVPYEIQSSEPSKLCDSTNIASNISDVVKDTDGNLLTGIEYNELTVKNRGNGTDLYLLSTHSAAYHNLSSSSNSVPVETVLAHTLSFFEESNRVNMLMFSNVTVSGHLQIEAGHDVTMYVNGNFTMDGSSSLTIPENSSLTLIITGKVQIGNGADVYTYDEGITDSGLPTFAIYSSYSGDDIGINFDGGVDSVYAVIYAPLTDVVVAAGVDFNGAVMGKSVTTKGSGAIHYDEALAELGSGSPGGGVTATLVFKGWKYVTEEPL